MIKFRFVANFVKLILSCITALDFVVLVNGSPTKWFKSTTRLRQGDPLSSYLFILGAEVFVKMIKTTQVKGVLDGVRIGDEGEVVSQLLM